MIKVLVGENSVAVKSELNRLVADFVQKNGDMALERIDGGDADYARITEAIQNLPFLSPEKMVVIKSPSSNKQFVENFAKLTETVPESIQVILVEPKPDKRSKYYKDLQKLTDYKNFEELDMRDLPRWVADEVKKRGGTISTSDANYLVDRIGVDQMLLSSELDKLLLADSAITRQMIDELTPRSLSSTIFQLIDVAFAGDMKKTIELYDEQRQQKVEPQSIIGLLAWQLHTLAIIKTAGDKSSADVAREAKINPYVVGKTMNLAKKISYQRLKELIAELKDLDKNIKTRGLDVDEALTNYLLLLSN